MITTEAFYAHFKAAGMLRAAAWTPSWGGPQQEAWVSYKAPAADVFGGDQSSIDYTIRYPAGALPGLKRNELITVSGKSYQVREDPQSRLDGSELETKLSAV